MTIAVRENPKSQKTKVDFKNPSSERNYNASGSTDKTAVILAVAAVAPSVDTTIDMQSGATIPLFLCDVDCDEAVGGGGNWNLVFHYSNTANTVDVAFNFGVETIKRFVSRADVRSYNALSPASADTNTAADAADAAANTLSTNADNVSPAAALAPTFATSATNAANVAGVDATVKTQTLLAATKLTSTISDTNAALAASSACAASTHAAAAASRGGDAVNAQNAAASASTSLTQVLAAAALATTDAAASVTAAAAATTAASGGNSQSIAAAAAATSASGSATSLDSDCSSLSTDAGAAYAAAEAAAAAAGSDTTPGNTVPNFHRMVGWDGAELKGYDVEVGKVEIAITKKWARATLAGTYLQTVADYNEQTPVNDATFVIIWMGQTLTFARGTLRFRTSTVKSDSGAALEISYNFHYQRNTTAADNFTVGNSAPIIKEGHHGVWIYSRLGDSHGRTVPVPQSIHIFEQYPYLPFGALNL